MHRVRNFFKGSTHHGLELLEVDLEKLELQDEQEVHVFGPIGFEEAENLAHAAFTAVTGDGCLKNLG